MPRRLSFWPTEVPLVQVDLQVTVLEIESDGTSICTVVHAVRSWLVGDSLWTCRAVVRFGTTECDGVCLITGAFFRTSRVDWCSSWSLEARLLCQLGQQTFHRGTEQLWMIDRIQSYLFIWTFGRPRFDKQ